MTRGFAQISLCVLIAACSDWGSGDAANESFAPRVDKAVYAEAGAPRETGGTLHRIDPTIVVSELEAAGFVLDAKSGMLRNMNDDYSKPVFDPAVRGRNDRLVMRFRKPR